ncbi:MULTISPECIES: TrbI F-type domain-containing protein [unclassified Providencia]|uniref:TrbI F-type domain-containing protein n=1 Tax=unclassified Providencia TaxID=2633465 RepID=UPI00234BD181|nr:MULTISPECIES: TrbI F-type domain-containing protein [unclassified Providencia]
MTNKNLTIALLISSLISVISLTMAIYLYVSTPKLVTFDIKNTTDTFLNQVAKLDLSEEEQQSLMKKYERTINQIIYSDYNKNNTIVFVKGAVVSNLKDETKNIKKQLAAKMKEGNEYDE